RGRGVILRRNEPDLLALPLLLGVDVLRDFRIDFVERLVHPRFVASAPRCAKERARVLRRGLGLWLSLACGCGAWSARREVWRGNQALYDGFRARDTARLRELMAADFRYLGADGKALD